MGEEETWTCTCDGGVMCGPWYSKRMPDAELFICLTCSMRYWQRRKWPCNLDTTAVAEDEETPAPEKAPNPLEDAIAGLRGHVNNDEARGAHYRMATTFELSQADLLLAMAETLKEKAK